jgi:ankyrin repeat protein
VAQDGVTPLHEAARNGHEAAIKALVAAKPVAANVHARMTTGWQVRVRGGTVMAKVRATRGLCVTVVV